MTLNPGLTSEIQKLAPSATIELFELDATGLGGDVLRFHAGTNGLSQNIVWQGNEYTRYPVKVTGFEFNGTGQLPRPKMQVSNMLSAVTALIRQYDDLLGVKIARRRTFARFLDAVNFPGGLNPSADPTAEFAPDVYYIDQKSSEDRDIVEFELSSAFDVVGIQLPRRQIIQNICIWAYRGAECGYAGPPLYDQNDNPISSSPSQAGLDLINARNAMLQAQADLTSAQAALSLASRNKDSACQYSRLEVRYDDSNSVFVSADGSIVMASWAGADVSLGSIYARGDFVWGDYIGNAYFKIERWGVNGSTCTPATSDYNAALALRDSKQSALSAAQTNYNAAVAALPTNDPLFGADRCGKRLTSCKLRFGSNSQLPFGGFPAAGMEQ